MIWSLEALAQWPVPALVVAALLTLLGFVVGIVSAAFGIGGGFVITPICHAVLGMPASLAVATSMGQIPLLSASGCWRYLRAGVIDLRLAGWLLLGAVPAAQVVAWWLTHQPPDAWPVVYAGQTAPDLILLLMFTLCIGGLGVYNIRRARETRDVQHVARRLTPGHIVIAGVGFGAMSALLGIGGGFFAVPLFTYWCGKTPVQAVATSLFAVLITSVITTAHYLWSGQIYFALSLIIAAGSVLGARTGARLALSAAPRTLLLRLGQAQVLICFGYLALKLL